MSEENVVVTNNEEKDNSEANSVKKFKNFSRQKRGSMPFKKKVCRLCAADAVMPDYKNPENLKKYITERGKIIPRKITGVCAKHQRIVAREIKKARILAYLPFDRK